MSETTGVRTRSRSGAAAKKKKLDYYHDNEEEEYTPPPQPQPAATRVREPPSSEEAMRVAVDCIRAGRTEDIPFEYMQYIVAADYFVQACLVDQIRRDARAREKDPANLVNEWHYGPPGTGKSFRIHAAYPDAYYAPLDGEKILFKGYRGEEVVVVDDLRLTAPATDLHALIQLVSRYAFLAEIRDGLYVLVRPKKVIVVCQFPLHETYGGWPNCLKLARSIDRVIHVSSISEEPRVVVGGDTDFVPSPPTQPPPPPEPATATATATIWV